MENTFNKYHENLLLELINDKSIHVYFHLNNRQLISNDYITIDKFLEKCIGNPDAEKELFRNFSHTVTIKFSSDFLNHNPIAQRLIEKDNTFGQVNNSEHTKYCAYEYELELNKFLLYSIKVKKFLLSKILHTVLLKKGELGQFKPEHLQSSTLGHYYLFQSILLNKNIHDETFLKYYLSNFFAGQTFEHYRKNFLYINFLNETLCLNNDYLFNKILTPSLAQSILKIEQQGSNTSHTSLIYLMTTLFSKDTIINFYDNYFTDLPVEYAYINGKILKLRNTPEYIKHKFQDKVFFGTNQLELKKFKNIHENISIQHEVSKVFEISGEELSLHYKRYSPNIDIANIVKFHLNTIFDDMEIQIKSTLTVSQKKDFPNIKYNVSIKYALEQQNSAISFLNDFQSIFSILIYKAYAHAFHQEVDNINFYKEGFDLKEAFNSSMLEYREHKLHSTLSEQKPSSQSKNRNKI